MQQSLVWIWFFRGYLVFFLLGMTGVLLLDKGELVVWFAQHRTEWGNLLFRGLTLLGDGLIIPIVVFCMLFVRFKYAILLLAIGLGQLLGAAFFKRTVFGNTPRPLRFFDPVDPNWLVPGIDTHSNYAFPSGHTITAFGLFTFLSLIMNKKWGAILCLGLAVLAGISRIYLFQHFLEDVLAGSAIGVAISASIYYVARNWPAFWEHPKLNKSLLRLKKPHKSKDQSP